MNALTRPGRDLDGHGRLLVDDASYYIQDGRTIVGNCASFWAPNGAGYVCDLNKAGIYTGKECRSKRETDIPWPIASIDGSMVVKHVRVEPLHDMLLGRDPREVE